MGLFDSIHCSYDLGSGFLGKTLQTKDLGKTMNNYWIDPSGKLYFINCNNTHNMSIYEFEIRWTPTGIRGKISPVYLTGEIEVYPSVWTCQYAPFPRKVIKFVDGIIVGELNEKTIYR